MLRGRRRGAFVLAALSLLTWLLAAPASAEENPHFTRFWVEATGSPEGKIDVEIDMEYDFDGVESHGVYLSFLTRKQIEGDPDHDRGFEITDAQAASDTAPADLREETTEDGVGFYIGDPDIGDLTGVHEYHFSFTIEGVVTSGVGDNGEDEVYWDVIGTGFDEPIKDIRVTLHAPNPIDGGCWAGRVGSTRPCDALDGDGTSVYYAQEYLNPGQGLTIAAVYPEGTFDDVQPILIERETFFSQMGSPGVLAAGVIASILTGLAGYFGTVWWRRDERFAGITPGTLPAEGGEPEIERAPMRETATVQFTPPDGVRPAELGTLSEGVAFPKFHAATIVDLAVRGHVSIEPTGIKNWRLSRLEEPGDDLTEYEEQLLDAVFLDEDPVRLDALSREARKALVKAGSALETDVVEHGWFTSRPLGSRSAVILTGIIIVMLSPLALAFGIQNGIGIFALAIAALGAGRLAAVSKAPKRTATGYALHVQGRGFRKFLETAEAGQLQFELDEDGFTTYLPHAMALGVVNRWVALFRQMSDDGTWTLPVHTNTVSAFAGMSADALSSSLKAMARTTTSLGASVSSSSGSGGSVGGGGGGGGGGRW